MKILKTKKLLIATMTDNELRSAILSETDEHMKNELHEMLQACLEHPEDHNWYTNWKIALHDGTVIGNLSFRGPQKNGAVEIHCNVFEEYRNRGYATEAVKQAIDWAFSDEKVYFITAEIDDSNLALKRVLEKLDFSPSDSNKERNMYEKERDKPSWMVIFMSIGISCGIGIGNSIDNVGLGMCLGMCFGLAIGQVMDSSDRKKREKLREARNVK